MIGSLMLLLTGCATRDPWQLIPANQRASIMVDSRLQQAQTKSHSAHQRMTAQSMLQKIKAKLGLGGQPSSTTQASPTTVATKPTHKTLRLQFTPQQVQLTPQQEQQIQHFVMNLPQPQLRINAGPSPSNSFEASHQGIERAEAVFNDLPRRVQASMSYDPNLAQNEVDVVLLSSNQAKIQLPVPELLALPEPHYA